MIYIVPTSINTCVWFGFVLLYVSIPICECCKFMNIYTYVCMCECTYVTTIIFHDFNEFSQVFNSIKCK